MKEFKVEIKNELTNGLWDSDSIADVIEAETAEEAIELAKDYLKEQIIDNDGDPAEVEEFQFLAIV